MSRIEEALRRAAHRHADSARPRAEEPATTRRLESVETPAVSAWHLDRLPNEGMGSEVSTGQEPFAAAAPDAPSPGAREASDQATASADTTTLQMRGGSSEAGRSAFAASMAEKLVVMKETSGLSVEQYRKAAASLHQIQMERGSKIVMVASALAGEGKTLTAVNLALTLSESYRRRVLLIDADLRRPQMHDVFKIPNGSGLNEGLKSAAEERLSLVEISPRLVLLPAGRPDPDPMSLLTSERMRRVIREAAAAFDWVIMDTPPVVMLPDTNLLADMVDLAVLVAAAGRTPYKMVARAVELLGRDRIAGVVLNGADEKVVAATSGTVYGGRYAYSAATAEHV